MKEENQEKIIVSEQDYSRHQLMQIRLRFKLRLNEEIVCMLRWQIYSHEVISSTAFFPGYLVPNRTDHYAI